MSQSATLYRVSEETFLHLEESTGEQQFDISSAKEYTTFQGTFMGLEYVLSKGQQPAIVDLVSQIFNPKPSLGGQDFDSLPLEEQFEFFESENQILYLDKDSIFKLDEFLNKFSEADIQKKYDANELNENGIYPEVWLDDDSPNESFNKRQLLEDFIKLKEIINQADKNDNYIFVFIG